MLGMRCDCESLGSAGGKLNPCVGGKWMQVSTHWISDLSTQLTCTELGEFACLCKCLFGGAVVKTAQPLFTTTVYSLYNTVTKPWLPTIGLISNYNALSCMCGNRVTLRFGFKIIWSSGMCTSHLCFDLTLNGDMHESGEFSPSRIHWVGCFVLFSFVYNYGLWSVDLSRNC